MLKVQGLTTSLTHKVLQRHQKNMVVSYPNLQEQSGFVEKTEDTGLTGMTRWKDDPAYPKPFSPVQRARKFSAVCNENAKGHCQRLAWDPINRGSTRTDCDTRGLTYLGDNVGTKFHGDTPGGLSTNGDIKVNFGERPAASVPKYREKTAGGASRSRDPIKWIQIPHFRIQSTKDPRTLLYPPLSP